MNDIELKILDKLVNAQYKFARTMPENPHWYTLRERGWDNHEFDMAVLLVRKYGIIEYFKGRPYTVFYHDGWKYWSMGAPIKETILINRAKADKDDTANRQPQG